MRDIGTIDAELRVLAVYRRVCAEDGRPVATSVVVDELLDERPGRGARTDLGDGR